ncbi:MAG: 4Fe-4S dicluster domain-containing protein [Clostridiales bacterium]|nr:4Fe-4S dicluster domain-containing protein [Clostridiales bacterium]
MSEAAIKLTKGELEKMLAALMRDRTVFAPGSTGAKLEYLPVDDVSDIVFGDELPYKSPKDVFFPRCEKIVTFSENGAEAELPETQTVLFGARPCDLEALDMLKTILTQGKFKDPFFAARYENALIIGLACAEKKPGCFCDQRETDLDYSEKCDLFLRADGDKFEVLYVSDKGKKALGAHIPGLEQFKNTPREFRPAETLSLDAAEDDLFTKIDWEEITETCQSCGICTYVCPTCHCFMFKDVEEDDKAYRYRNWDSCMFPKFTLHASGHNPRAAKRERYRQRVAHKYVYIKENFGMTACTGCGRCIRSCPAGMSIKTVVEGIREELQ